MKLRSPQAVVLKEVNKSFGSVSVLSQFSLMVSQGEHLLVRGANGTGKSTLLRIMATLCHPDSGCVELFGAKPSAREDITYLGSLLPFISNFTVAENIDFWRRIDPCFHMDKFTETQQQIAPSRFASQAVQNRRCNELSAGEQQRLALMLCLSRDTPLYLFDEPMIKLDQASRDNFLALLESLKKQGKTVVVASHLTDLLVSWCHRAVDLGQVETAGIA